MRAADVPRPHALWEDLTVSGHGHGPRGVADGRKSGGGDGHPVAALAVLVVALGLALASIVLLALNDPEWTQNQWYFLVDLADAVVYGLVAWLILARRTHPGAWILALTAVGGGVAALSFEWANWLATHPDGPTLNPLPSAQSWAWVPGTLALVLVVPWLIREGPLDRRARAAVAAGVALTASFLLLRLTDPWPWPDGPTATPFPIRSTWWVDLAVRLEPWLMGGVVVLGSLGAADVVRRWVARPLEERRGLGWLAVGVVPLILSFVPLALPAGWVEGLPVAFIPLLHLSSQLFFPAAVLVAVLRQRLWGLDLVVSRAVLWALLTAAVVASYVAAVAALSPLLAREQAPEVLATALVAAGFQPARAWLQRRVDRLVRGEAANPLRAVRRVGLGPAGDGEDALAGLADGLAASLRLGSVAIELAAVPGEGAGTVVTAARVGEAVGEEVEVPLVSHQGVIGRLVVTARPGERLDAHSRTSLDELGPVVATAVELAVATRALGRSRRRLAAARDEERRALRRELHDGLGPALAGINLGLQAARNQLATDPALAAELLDRISAELDGRVEEVRGLARGLLPPALGELGLEPALAGLAERYAVTGLDVRLALAADALAEVPPDVADNVYAIVSEAVRNVHRHAGATSCEVRIALDAPAAREPAPASAGPGGDVAGAGVAVADPPTGLVVSVTDDGSGVGTGAALGVGLVSMRERAEGLGGTLAVTPSAGGGTRVEVKVPRAALAAGA